MLAENVICVREYVSPESDPPRTVTARMAIPKQRPEDGLFECAVEIDDSGERYARTLVGVDSLEALLVALTSLGVDLKLSTEPDYSLWTALAP